MQLQILVRARRLGGGKFDAILLCTLSLYHYRHSEAHPSPSNTNNETMEVDDTLLEDVNHSVPFHGGFSPPESCFPRRLHPFLSQIEAGCVASGTTCVARNQQPGMSSIS